METQQEKKPTQDYSELDAPGAAFSLLPGRADTYNIASENEQQGAISSPENEPRAGLGEGQTVRDSSDSAMRLDPDAKPAAVQQTPSGWVRCNRASGSAPDVLTKMREAREAELMRTPPPGPKPGASHAVAFAELFGGRARQTDMEACQEATERDSDSLLDIAPPALVGFTEWCLAALNTMSHQKPFLGHPRQRTPRNTA